MRKQGFHARQCTAKSKRSNERCRAYGMIGKNVCAFHGGKSLSGINHGRFKHGKRTKTPTIFADLLKPNPILVTVSLFPYSLDEIAMKIGQAKTYRSMIIPPSEVVPFHDWIRALRTAKKSISDELARLRDAIEIPSQKPPTDA